MKLLLALLFVFSSAKAQDIFKDLRTYYEACGLVGREDPRFEACNPPTIAQIMENFKKDPKNVEDMKKISRFHMTHSLQAEAKKSLLNLANSGDLKKASLGNESFVLSFCAGKTTLDDGQKLKDPTPLKLKTIRETFTRIQGEYPCPRGGFQAFAVGVVDVTGNPDAWMINDKKELKHILRSTGVTPFSNEPSQPESPKK